MSHVSRPEDKGGGRSHVLAEDKMEEEDGGGRGVANVDAGE